MENIDKFNDFLDKYTKTGYISKRSKDLLDEFGIDKEVIDSLNKNINNLDEKNKMINFIKDNLTDYIIPVYFDMIKCPYKFTVNNFYISYTGSCDIKITLDI